MLKSHIGGFVGVLAGDVFPLFEMGLGLCDLPMTDSIVYLGVKFKFGYKLMIDYSIRSRKFLVCVYNILRNKVVGYEDVFANILDKQYLPILEYILTVSI